MPYMKLGRRGQWILLGVAAVAVGFSAGFAWSLVRPHPRSEYPLLNERP